MTDFNLLNFRCIEIENALAEISQAVDKLKANSFSQIELSQFMYSTNIEEQNWCTQHPQIYFMYHNEHTLQDLKNEIKKYSNIGYNNPSSIWGAPDMKGQTPLQLQYPNSQSQEKLNLNIANMNITNDKKDLSRLDFLGLSSTHAIIAKLLLQFYPTADFLTLTNLEKKVLQYLQLEYPESNESNINVNIKNIFKKSIVVNDQNNINVNSRLLEETLYNEINSIYQTQYLQSIIIPRQDDEKLFKWLKESKTNLDLSVAFDADKELYQATLSLGASKLSISNDKSSKIAKKIAIDNAALLVNNLTEYLIKSSNVGDLAEFNTCSLPTSPSPMISNINTATLNNNNNNIENKGGQIHITLSNPYLSTQTIEKKPIINNNNTINDNEEEEDINTSFEPNDKKSKEILYSKLGKKNLFPRYITDTLKDGTFKSVCYIKDTNIKLGVGHGSSKKMAEQAAAKKGLASKKF